MREQITAWEYLELVAGELCPCGHYAADHDQADGSVSEPGTDMLVEDFGPCTKCLCDGVMSVVNAD